MVAYFVGKGITHRQQPEQLLGFTKWIVICLTFAHLKITILSAEISNSNKVCNRELPLSCNTNIINTAYAELHENCDGDGDIRDRLQPEKGHPIPTEFIGIAEGDPEYPHDSQLVFNNKGQLVEASGHVVSLFYDLSTAIKFRPVLQKGDGWGEKLPNGSWTGMPNQLLDPKYDLFDNVLSISSTTLTLERVSEFTFLQPTYGSHYFAHFRPPPSKAFRNVFLQPFQPGVWQSILIVSIILGFILKISYHYRNRRIKINDEIVFSIDKGTRKLNLKFVSDVHANFTLAEGNGCENDNDTGSFSDLFLWIIANVCQTGWSLEPQSNSMRIVFFCFVLTMTVLYVAYSATLVSILSLDDELQISDLSQLHSKHITIFGDEEIPFIFKVMEAAIHNNSSSVAKHAMKRGEAVHKLMTSKIAIVTVEGFYNEFRRQNYSEREYCGNISTIVIRHERRQAGMYVRRHWKFKELFAKTMIQIIERGLNFRYIKIANQASRPHCDRASQKRNTQQQIVMDDAITAFILLGVGMGISLALLAIENTVLYLECLNQEFHVQKFLRP